MILIFDFHSKGWSICWAFLGYLSKKIHRSKKINPCSWTTHADNAIIGVRWFTSLFILLVPKGKKSVSLIVSETSETVVQVLLQDYMSPPETEEQWKCQIIKEKKKKKSFLKPVFPNWLIFGRSVAWHVYMKLAKLFELIQNGFGDMPYKLSCSGYHYCTTSFNKT